MPLRSGFRYPQHVDTHTHTHLVSLYPPTPSSASLCPPTPLPTVAPPPLRAWHRTHTADPRLFDEFRQPMQPPLTTRPLPPPSITLLLYPSPLPPTVPPSGPMRCFRGHSWLRIFHGQLIRTQTFFFFPAETEHTHTDTHTHNLLEAGKKLI